MLNLEDREAIKNICNRENSDDFISALISEYASSVDHCYHLINEIPTIVNKQLTIVNKIIQDINTGLTLAMFGLGSEEDFHRTTGSAVQLIWILNAKLKYESDINQLDIGTEKLLHLFIDLIQKKKSETDFQYKSKQSWEWAKMFHLDKLVLDIVKTYIDSEFDPDVLFKNV